MKSKYEQNPYVRKHIHRWKLTKDTPASKGGWFFGTNEDPTPRRLIRECEDCGVKQTASVEDNREEDVIKGYEAISDLPWKDLV